MNEKTERKSVFFAFSLLAHFLLVILLLSMPAKMKRSSNADYSRRVIIDFDIPAPPKSGGGKSVEAKEKSAIKLSAKPLSSMGKTKTSSVEKTILSDKPAAVKEDLPIEFSFDEQKSGEVFGIGNVSFAEKGRQGAFSSAGFGNGEGFGFGKGKGKDGVSGRDSGEGAYYTNYYQLCLEKIEEQKKYPQIAVIRQIEGEVEVKITLSPDGSVSELEIIKSSGWDMLDSEATECVRHASPFPAPPKEILRDSKLVLSFTIAFELS